MDVLDNVRIGSSDYKIIISNQVLVVDRCECKGMIDFEFHQIKINNQVQDKQGQEQTFLHELIHGIVKERSLDLLNSDEETIVNEIALGLHQVIRDNKSIFTNKNETNIDELTEKVTRNMSNTLKSRVEGR
ncbi:hypothetical protein [Clostridium senegalense]|uniref:hypothetical protein n=1 Tax=Clostridium senegalense TaxID=1465809 RepID=UPI000289F3B3|nr:hypothetical protein [Clostridium senegalense]